MMCPLSQVHSLSPSNSQSSSSCRSVEVVFPQLSQRQTGKQAHQRSRKARAISISSDEENAPICVAVHEPSGSSRGRDAGTARGGRARPKGKRSHNAEPADPVPTPRAVKREEEEEEEEEEELHVLRFKHHLDSFKAPSTSAVPLRQQRRPTEVAAAAPIASSSRTRFTSPGQQRLKPTPPVEHQHIKTEPSSQAFSRGSPVKVEAESAGAQPRSLSITPSSLNNSSVGHHQPKLETEEDDSVEFQGSQFRRPYDERSASRPMGTANASLSITDDDSIIFSTTDADSSVEGQRKAARGRKKPTSDKTPSKPRAKAKAKTPKASNAGTAAKTPKTPAAESSKPTTEGSPKPKPVRVPKPLPVDVSSIPNFLFSVLRICPLCGPAHEFPPKQAPPTRRRHVSYCAFAKLLTSDDVEDILQQEMVRLEQLERLEYEQAEAAKTTFVRTIEESGLKLVDTRDDDVWRMLQVERTDPKRKISSITVAELAAGWGQGDGNTGTTRKRRRFGGPQSLLKPHCKVRREIEQRARELLDDFDDIQAISLSQRSTRLEIDEDTGDILAEMDEEIFPFPGDQRLAEERFTQALMPPISSFASDSDFAAGGMTLPPATQMPSSTWASRSSSLLARRRPPVSGAGDGLFALFKRLDEKKREWEREETQRKIEEGIAQRRAESLRRQREALAAAAAAAAAEATEVESVASQEDLAEDDAGEGGVESWWEKRMRQFEELEREEQQEREEAERRRLQQEESWESSYVEEAEGDGDDEGRAEEGGAGDTLPSPAPPPSSGAWKPFNSYTFEHS